MRIAITGGKGFIGTHLAQRLVEDGHQVVLLGRYDRGERCWPAQVRFVKNDLSDPRLLAEAFAGCDAVAHCAGINREIGKQTFRRVHIEGTRHVVEAAKQAGVKRIALMSFLRARPNCGSRYHESKWLAERIVRESGLDYTIVRAYGRLVWAITCWTISATRCTRFPSSPWSACAKKRFSRWLWKIW